MTVTMRVAGLGLKKGYNLLIHNLNFELAAGEIISLTGENGVGKTTLLRTLAGFQAADDGTVAYFENGSQIESDMAPAKLIHFLGHHDALSPSCTVGDELAFQADYLGGSVVGLEVLNLGALMDLETRYLSAGQKRRLSLARLVMAKRAIWLLDEPMAPLDGGHRDLLAGLMKDHVAAGGAIIAAVHDALPFETRVLRLERPTLAQREAAFG